MATLKDLTLIDFLPELEFQTSRSGGAGGQNVNKVETKVLLKFNIENSKIFDELDKQIIREKLAITLIDDNYIYITCQESRSQLKNKEIAIKKFKNLIKSVFVVPKVRKPSPIPKSIVEKRLSTKKRDAEIKENRSKVDW